MARDARNPEYGNETETAGAAGIKSYHPMTLFRKAYLSANLFISNGLLDHAASGAFYFLLSIIPTALLVLYVFDTGIGSYGRLSDYFFTLLSRFNPEINRSFFEQIGLLGAHGKSFFGIVGVVGLVWSSRSVFSGVKNALDIVFSGGTKRGFLKDSLISLIFVPVVFASCFVFFAATVVIKRLAGIFEKFGVPYFAGTGAVDFYTACITFFMVFFITFFLYRFLPYKKPGTADVIPGALLFTFASFIIQKLLVGVVSMAGYYMVYGVISTLIAGLFWVYVIFAAFYLCAEVVYVQSVYAELEFNAYYIRAAKGRGGAVTNFLFKNPELVISRYGKKYLRGEAIFREGDAADRLFVLRKGAVETFRTEENGKRKVSIIREGEAFGEQGFLSRTAYDRTAVAEVESDVLVIPESFYERALSMDPGLSREVLNSFVSHLIDRDKADEQSKKTDDSGK